jgi:hypothetical protein
MKPFAHAKKRVSFTMVFMRDLAPSSLRPPHLADHLGGEVDVEWLAANIARVTGRERQTSKRGRERRDR